MEELHHREKPFMRLNINLKNSTSPRKNGFIIPSGHICGKYHCGSPRRQAASVKGVAFNLNAGETLGVIGPSAAGKRVYLGDIRRLAASLGNSQIRWSRYITME